MPFVMPREFGASLSGPRRLSLAYRKEDEMRVSTLCMVATLAATMGCKPPPSQSNSNDNPPQAATSGGPEEEARQIYAGRCTPCHGATGGGDGAAAAALTPRPRNFHDATWQSSVTDAQIETAIRQGGAAVGKSAAMPPNPDLNDKPAVITALRTMIRGWR